MANALFEIRKFLPALLSPLILSIVLMLWGVLRRQRKVAVAGILLLLVAGIPAVSDSLNMLLERQYPHLEPAQCPQADAIVALGGYVGVNQRFPRELDWRDSVERFESAIHLYHLGKAPFILLTNTKTDTGNPPTIGELLRQAVLDHDVPPGAIRLTPVALITADEAVSAKQFLQETGGHRVILVTSAAHMPRAALLFRQAGVDFIPFPVDYQSEGWVWKWDKFLPSAAGLDQFGKFEHEILGLTVMRLKSLTGR